MGCWIEDRSLLQTHSDGVHALSARFHMLLVALSMQVVSLAPAQGTAAEIAINEVSIHRSFGLGFRDFVEIRSHPNASADNETTLVVLDKSGVILSSIDIGGSVFSSDGLLLISPPGSVHQLSSDVVAPLGFGGDSTRTLILAVGKSFNIQPGLDLDLDDNGLFDHEEGQAAAPWTAELDKVTLAERQGEGYGPVKLIENGLMIPHAYRCEGPRHARYFLGSFGDATEDTPRMTNPCSVAAESLRISEVRAAHAPGAAGQDSGQDRIAHYIELNGPPREILSPYHVVIIGRSIFDAANKGGVVHRVLPMPGQMPDAGFAAVGQGPIQNPVLTFSVVPMLEFDSAGAISLLVVSGLDDRLVTLEGMDLDRDDDGIIDSPIPWGYEVASISLAESELISGATLQYSSRSVGPTASGLRPAHAFWCPNDNIELGNFDTLTGDTAGTANLACSQIFTDSFE
jgi:hypothetical protein